MSLAWVLAVVPAFAEGEFEGKWGGRCELIKGDETYGGRMACEFAEEDSAFQVDLGLYMSAISRDDFAVTATQSGLVLTISPREGTVYYTGTFEKQGDEIEGNIDKYIIAQNGTRNLDCSYHFTLFQIGQEFGDVTLQDIPETKIQSLTGRWRSTSASFKQGEITTSGVVVLAFEQLEKNKFTLEADFTAGSYNNHILEAFALLEGQTVLVEWEWGTVYYEGQLAFSSGCLRGYIEEYRRDDDGDASLEVRYDFNLAKS